MMQVVLSSELWNNEKQTSIRWNTKSTQLDLNSFNYHGEGDVRVVKEAKQASFLERLDMTEEQRLN
jgi:hypothetical protein